MKTKINTAIEVDLMEVYNDLTENQKKLFDENNALKEEDENVLNF